MKIAIIIMGLMILVILYLLIFGEQNHDEKET
jgi:hypothetical protein